MEYRLNPRSWGLSGALSALVFAGTFYAALPANAELTLCGREWATPGEMLKQIAETEKLPEVHRDQYYVAYQDQKAETMWTFTLPGIPAHPTVVCRKPVKEGDKLELLMDINCNGGERACDALVKDFRLLNSQMAKQMNKQHQ